jgi:hypothetical protein
MTINTYKEMFENQTVKIKDIKGRFYTGKIVLETKNAVSVITIFDEFEVIARDDIVNIKPSDKGVTGQ